MKIFRDLEQGSDEWHAIRKGKPSTSRLSAIITAAKGELSKSRVAYIRELIGECFAPDWEEFAGNKYTERGVELEPEARDAFIAETLLDVIEVGGVLGDDGVSWCSPDGLLFDEAGNISTGLEIKCPSPRVHIGYILDGVLPSDYKQQVHGAMAITGAERWHFWSYFPGLRPFHLIVERDDYTRQVAAALAEFVTEYKIALNAARPLIALPAIEEPMPRSEPEVEIEMIQPKKAKRKKGGKR
jgi:hypothetical protein